jgi:preprotein translocase subunit SecA
MYDKLAGMTGTASTEAAEFGDIYKLEVVEIPTNVPVAGSTTTMRSTGPFQEKDRAIVKLIDDCKERGQPILVGTTSIEKSELLAEMLKKHGYKQIDFSDPQRLSGLL